MPLSDFQQSYRGLVMGPGLPVHAMKITGLEDVNVRSGDSPLPRSDGDVPGLHTLASKEVVLELAVTGPKRSEAFATTLANALEVFSPSATSFPFVFAEPNDIERYINLRVVARERVRDAQSTHGFQILVVRLKAADPYIYSVETHSETLTPYTIGGGADYPGDYPKDPAVIASGEVVAVNNGNIPAYPLIRFYGPTDGGTLLSVKLTSVNSGQELYIIEPILVDQIMTADMKRLMRADSGDSPYIRLGESNRYGKWQLPRTPFSILPGSDVLRYEITGTTTATACAVTWQDTYS